MQQKNQDAIFFPRKHSKLTF